MIELAPSACTVAKRIFSLANLYFARFSLYSRRGVILVSIVLSFANTACRKLSQERYIKWIRDYDNNVHVQAMHNDFIFDLQFQPSAYILLQRGIENYSDSARSRELDALSALQYYTLSISRKDKGDLIVSGANTPSEKEERQYYLSYRLQDDITLEENGKILPCVLYHGERPAVAGSRTFVLAFENPETNSAKAEILIRSEMFGSSPVKIAVSKFNIPQVDL